MKYAAAAPPISIYPCRILGEVCMTAGGKWHGRPLKANLCSGLLACFLIINSSLPSPSWGTKGCVSGSAGGDGDCSSADRHACSIRGSTAGFRKSIRSAAKKGASSIPRFAIEPGIITDAPASVPLPLAFLGSCARPVVRHAAFYKGLYFALCAFPHFPPLRSQLPDRSNPLKAVRRPARSDALARPRLSPELHPDHQPPIGCGNNMHRIDPARQSCAHRVNDLHGFFETGLITDVAGIMERKMKYNESRPCRHGGKKC